MILIFFPNLNWIMLSKLTITTVQDTFRDKATYVFLHKAEMLHFCLVAGSIQDTVLPHDQCTLAVLVYVVVDHCHDAACTTVYYAVVFVSGSHCR